jgi:exosortase A-associated hydrolase 2
VVFPFFLEVERRRLLCVLRGANGVGDARHAVLLVPPIGEELNQTRHFYALIARALESVGIASLSVDLSSTGDSSGDFRDARVAHWVSDLEASHTWLRERFSTVSLMAVRSGALLVGLLSNVPAAKVECCSLVDPVLTGCEALNTMLQTRVIRSLFSGERESLVSLRGKLFQERYLEIAGYELSSALHDELILLEFDPISAASHFPLSVYARSERADEDLVVSGKRGPGEDLKWIRVESLPSWTSEKAFVDNSLVDSVVGVFDGRARAHAQR